jgi:hypothetical protein
VIAVLGALIGVWFGYPRSTRWLRGPRRRFIGTPAGASRRKRRASSPTIVIRRPLCARSFNPPRGARAKRFEHAARDHAFSTYLLAGRCDAAAPRTPDSHRQRKLMTSFNGDVIISEPPKPVAGWRVARPVSHPATPQPRYLSQHPAASRLTLRYGPSGASRNNRRTVARDSDDLKTIREEIALARVEIREEAGRARRR